MNTTVAENRTRHFFIRHSDLMADRPSTEEERRKHNNNAGLLMISMACLNSFLIDLEDELRTSNIFRHNVKRYFKRVEKSVYEMTNLFYEGAHKVNGNKFVQDYNEDVDNATDAINKAVLLEAPERAYNIVLSLIRIAVDTNGKIGRFKRDFVEELLPTINWLKEFQIKDYNIDFIVRNAIINI